MKKRIYAILLAAVMAVAVAACGSTEKKNDTEGTEQQDGKGL